MKIYLVRHGKTNYNELGLCNADPSVDVHLSETGIAQAKKLGADLRDADFEQVFISELRRTKQTAAYINEYHHAPITVDPRLNDNRNGYEGKKIADYYAVMATVPNRWEAKFGDGESLQEAIDRARAFLEDLKRKPYKSVLIVTSMSIAQAIYGAVNNLSNDYAWAAQIDNGSCTELEI